MEYKGATIAAMVIFAMLFVGAIFMMKPDPENPEDPNLPTLKGPKVVGKVPAPQPDNIDEDADTEYTELPSGLKYKILRKSDKRKPSQRDAVAVAYKGWTEGGKTFDSSYGRDPPYFELNPPWGVIEGWKQAIPLLGEGGMMEIEIPPELGYADQGSGDIEPNSTLFFKVEILKIFTDDKSEK